MDEDDLFQFVRRTRCVDGQILMIANIMIRSAATSNSANILLFGEEMKNSAAVFIVALLFSEYPTSQNL